MTTTSAVAPTTTRNTDIANSAAQSATVDYNSFLKLLVAQMKNQDPTQPVDGTEYVAQLATFSNVEQAIQTNSKLDLLLTSSALSQADGIIGRTVTSADGTKSGVVESVKIYQDGMMATLKDGTEVPIVAGVVIS
ncbi:MAG: flagellar hook assembly protein FlgD [Phyllobacterium sp.]